MLNFLSLATTLVQTRILGMRKGTSDVPNWTHSFHVRDILRSHNFSDEVVLAGLLHDIVEDGNTSFDDLHEMGFSERVVALVDLCSHDMAMQDGDLRWRKMMARLEEAGDADAWAIKVADITDNLRSSNTLPEERQRFFREVKGKTVLELSKPFLGETLMWKELEVEVGK